MRRILWLAVIVALEFCLGVGGVFVVHAPAAERPRPTKKHVAVKHVPSPLDPIVEEVSRFVETSRGLKFKHKVRAALLDDAAFNKRLLGDQGLPNEAALSKRIDQAGLFVLTESEPVHLPDGFPVLFVLLTDE